MSAKAVRTSAIVLVLGALLGAIAAWRRTRPVTVAPVGPPEWPPIRPASTLPVAEAPVDKGVTPAEVTPAEVTATEATAAGITAWVPARGDGSLPDGFPVKVKLSSGIFHVPGGRFYDRTSPDRCYTTAAAAEADGYRQSKS